MPGSIDGLRSGVRGNVAINIDHCHLPYRFVGIRRHQSPERLGCRATHRHEFEAQWTIRHFNERLCGNRTDTSLGERNKGANREPVRLHRHAKLTRFGVSGYDRVRIDWSTI